MRADTSQAKITTKANTSTWGCSVFVFSYTGTPKEKSSVAFTRIFDPFDLKSRRIYFQTLSPIHNPHPLPTTINYLIVNNLLKKINLGMPILVAPTLVPWLKNPRILLGCVFLLSFWQPVYSNAPYKLESSSTQTRGETFQI